MELNTTDHDHYTVVTIKGRLDSLSADNFQATISTLINEGTIFLIIDFEEISFLSSAGMRAILVALKEVERVRGRLIFFGFSETIAEILELSGIGKYLEHKSSKQEAERAMFHYQRQI